MEITLNEDLYKEVSDFLMDSSNYYATDVERAKRDLEFYSGDQWNFGDKPYFARGSSRVNMMLSELPKYVCAIQSSANKSPYHNEVTYENNEGQDVERLSEIQSHIDKTEADNSYKTVLMKSLYQDIITGIGACDLTTVEENGVAKIVIEHIRDVSTVAFDPACEEDDMSDAEQCALVTWMSKRKAKRKYGEDVCDIKPDEMNFGTQFRSSADDDTHVPIITYYHKEDDGVHVHKMVGKYEVAPETVLNISHIPVFKMSGYSVMRNGKFTSVGIVDKVKELQVGLNLAYSQLIERLNRSVKAGFVCEIEAIEGLQDQISKLSSGDVPLFLYKKGFNPPVPIKESFEVNDLNALITSTQSLMAATIGVPSAGVNGINNVEKTATESLLQQENSESNVGVFYQALSNVSRLIGITMCELITGTTDLPFLVKVVNGPEVITRNSRRRLELNTMSQMVPDPLKPVIAKYYADTLDDSIGTELSGNIVANMDPSIKLISKTEDPEVIHMQNQAKQMIDQQQEIIQKLMEEKAQLEQENQTLSLSLIDNREARSVDLAKALMENERQAAKDRAEIALQSAEIALQYETDIRDSNLKAAEMVSDAVAENNKIVTEELGRIPDVVAKSPMGFNEVPDGSWNQ